MFDVRRFLTCLMAVTTIATIAQPGLTSELTTNSPSSVGTDVSQNSNSDRSEEDLAERELPRQWLVPAIGLAVVMAVVMLFLLFKPENRRSDRDADAEQ